MPHAEDTDLPTWLAAPSCSQPEKKPTARPNGQRHVQVQSKATPGVAEHEAEAASQSVDAAEAEHVLDVWESDTDEPDKPGKHRWASLSDSFVTWAGSHMFASSMPGSSLHAARCRLCNGSATSCSESETDDGKERWKVTPEDSKPKQRQVKHLVMYVPSSASPACLGRGSACIHIGMGSGRGPQHAQLKHCHSSAAYQRVCGLIQVFFCSRTHSQLSQFVSELQRTAFADTIATVALASRKVSNMRLELLHISRLQAATALH